MGYGGKYIRSLVNVKFIVFSFVAAILVIGFLSDTSATEAPVSPTVPRFRSAMLQVGEELEYKVSYSFFTIGTIRIQVKDKEQRNGRMVYKANAIIDSNPSLDWLVELHIRFATEMDEDVFSYSWVGDDSSKKEVNFRRFNFDYDQNRLLYEKGKKLSTGERKVESADTVKVIEKCQDGFSLFFYAREHALEKTQVNIPTFIENKQVSTFIDFLKERTDMDIDAVDYPVDVIKFEGKADYVGVFGMTGGFRGWFSNDDARIPIVARMNVILGSIKIQLMKWNRPGWQPPKYVEDGK